MISVEILAQHADFIRQRLQCLGYGTVEVLTGDAAALGLFVPESFDAVAVAAGAPKIPSTLMAALKVGG